MKKRYTGKSVEHFTNNLLYDIVAEDDDGFFIRDNNGYARFCNLNTCTNYFVDVDSNVSNGSVRTFDTGATRDTDKDKLDFDGFLSHDVLVSYANYMHRNRYQADGCLRDSDNWKKGIPKDQYIKSMFRHFMDVWSSFNDSDASTDDREVHLNALLFNVMGLLHEEIKSR